MGFDRDRLRRIFPNLAKELDDDNNKVAINSVRTDSATGEKASSKRFIHYMPDVIDFIRRCDTIEQADEIVSYMERTGQIEKNCAIKIKNQLKDEGVRSFGQKKEDDYYSKHVKQ